MRIDYAPRAIRDLDDIGVYCRTVAPAAVVEAFGERLGRVIGQLALHPLSAPRVAGRADIRVLLMRRYPYKIFYRPRGDVIEILHIRHTARRPWRRD